MRDEGVLEDWQPGDGVSCRFSIRAATPCPFPIKTRVQTETYVTSTGTKTRVKRVPLCENHLIRGERSGDITRARKVAIERLVQMHSEEYQQYIDEAISSIKNTKEQLSE